MTTLDAADFRSKQTEAQWQKTIVDAARRLRWTCVHFPNMLGNPTGWPDWIMIRDGRVLFVELKREDGKLSIHQEHWLTLLDAEGCETYVWRPSDYERAVAVLGGEAT